MNHALDFCRNRGLRLVSTLAAAAFFALAGAFVTPASAAKIKASAVIQQTGGSARVQVSLSSTGTPSAKKKPRSVKVKAGGKTIKLSRSSAAGTAAAYASSWRSKAFTGAYAAKLAALNGKRVKVTISARSGKTVAQPKALVQTGSGGGGGGGGGGGPLFGSPGTDLVGNPAFDYLSKYFLNSAFSDCAAGPWPNCTVEHRYVHCPSGSWEYHRNTPTSGSDIHAYDSFQVTGANVFADGSWAISYTIPSSGAIYIWQVTNLGVATGQYQFNSSAEALGPMYWSQPAITWQQPTGAC